MKKTRLALMITFTPDVEITAETTADDLRIMLYAASCSGCAKFAEDVGI